MVVDGNETDVVTEDSEVAELNLTTNAYDDYYGGGGFGSIGVLEEPPFCNGIFYYGRDKTETYVPNFKLELFFSISHYGYGAPITVYFG